jgi:hypothetical protein
VAELPVPGKGLKILSRACPGPSTYWAGAHGCVQIGVVTHHSRARRGRTRTSPSWVAQ